MQQQAGPAPTMMPTMPQTPATQPPAASPRDPAEYTQFSLAHSKTAGRFGSAGLHSPPAPRHVLWGQNKRHSSAFVQSHEGRDRRAVCPPKTAAGAAHGHSTDATAGPEPPGSTIPQPQSAQNPSAPTKDPSDQMPVPDLQLDEEWVRKWTQEATTASQQPPSRFRPSNYTVDLSNTTNPPPAQVMVKPAVMLRRDERPEPVSFSVTDAAHLPHPFGNGVGVRNPRGNLLRTCRDTP